MSERLRWRELENRRRPRKTSQCFWEAGLRDTHSESVLCVCVSARCYVGGVADPQQLWTKTSTPPTVTLAVNPTSQVFLPIIATAHTSPITSIPPSPPHSFLMPPLPPALSLRALNHLHLFIWMCVMTAIRLSLFPIMLFGPWLGLWRLKNGSSWTFLWEEIWIPIIVGICVQAHTQTDRQRPCINQCRCESQKGGMTDKHKQTSREMQYTRKLKNMDAHTRACCFRNTCVHIHLAYRQLMYRITISWTQEYDCKCTSVSEPSCSFWCLSDSLFQGKLKIAP